MNHRSYSLRMFVILLLSLMVVLLSSTHSIFHEVHASSRTITLQGYNPGGWNNTSPVITVNQGDVVTIKFIIGDGAPHQFWLDFDGDGINDQSDCSSTGDQCSASFSTTAPPPITFTASSVGTFTFYCTFHYPAMQGTFKVLGSSPPPDFSIASNPTSLSITQGASGTSTITVSSLNGFSGTITLSASVSPAGPTTSFNPMNVPISSGSSGTSTITVSTAGSTPPGPYTVTISATNGTLTHPTTLSVTVTVPDFQIAPFPASLSITQNSTAASTITLSSLYGFSGNLNLTASVSPSGPTLSFSETTVALVSGGTVQSVLTVSAVGGPNNSVAPGTYSVNVTVTSGMLSHWKTIQATVTPPVPPVPPLPLTVLAGAGVIIVAAVAVTVFLVRKRAK